MLFQIARGKNAGQILEVHQICNDWVTAITLDGERANGGQPISLRHVYFDGAGRKELYEMHRNKQLGSMFTRFYDINEFLLTGMFKRRKIEWKKLRNT